MAGASGIRAGRAYVELGVDDKIAAGLKKAQQHLSDFGAAVRSVGVKMMALGGAVTGALSLAANNFATTGDDIAKVAERTGLSTRAVQELGFAAKMADIDMAELEKGVRLMQKGLVNASAAGIQSANVFSDLGLSVEKLRNLSPDQQFAVVADRLSAIKDPAAKAAIAMEIFGKSGTTLLPLLNEGSKGLAAMRARARELGVVMDESAIKAAVAMDDALKELWASTKAVANGLGAAVAPIIVKVTKQVTDFLGTLIKWINQNGELIRTVFMVAKWVTIAGAAVVAIGYAITAIGGVIGGIGAIITFVGTAIGAITAAVTFLLSPIGLTILAITAVVAAVAVLAAAFIHFSGIGASVLNWLTDKFGDLAKKVFGGIADALAEGNIELAAQILWLGLKSVWYKGVHELNQAWESAKLYFLDIAYKMWYGAVDIAQRVFHKLEVAWTETVAFIVGAASAIWQAVLIGFEKVTTGYAKAAVWLQSLIGLLSSTEEKAAIAAIDAEYKRKIDAIDQETNRRMAALDKTREAERKTAKDLHDLTIAQIGKEYATKIAAARAAARAAAASSAADLKEVEAKLNEAIAEAKRQRELKTTNANNDAKMQGIAAAARYVVLKYSSVGTFSANQVGNLGAGGAALDHIAKATEETARNTRKLLNQGTDGESLITLGG